jgi:glycosyltransferase involved in cell wall biosynthesis
MARLARRLGVDLVQLNAPALAAGAAFPVPTLGFLHSCVATWWQSVRGNSPLPPDLEWRAKLTRAGLNRVDAALAPSYALARQAQLLYALPRAPGVIHNGKAARDKVCARTRDIAALTAGRLWDEGKNIAALDRAAEHLPFKISAAGPVQGPNGAEINLTRLDWLGTLEPLALQGLMARAQVFVSTAFYEPFGLAVLEAAQAGCALVLSDIPTFRELWDGAALFVPPSDSAAIADALRRLTADATLRVRLAAAAEQHAARYTIESSADRLAAVMRSLLMQQQRRAS